MSFFSGLLSCIFGFFLGATIFSFLNVVAYRMPREMDFVGGRSFCPRCKHSLAFADMIPVISYFMLNGRCKYCGSRIPRRYLWMELFGGITFLFAFINYGVSLEALLVFLFVGALVVVSLIDAETMEIPDELQVAILVLAVLDMLFGKTPFLTHLIGLFIISVPMLLIVRAVPDGFGGGDIKLMAVSGFFMGWKLALVATVIGVILGGIYATYLIATKKNDRKGHFAFGPFLSVGIYIAMFWGTAIINAYLGVLM